MAKFKTIIITLFVAALIPWFAGAQEIPSPDEAFKVIDFYMNGKGNGMVLMESKVCKDIHREGSLKYECKNEIIEFGEMQVMDQRLRSSIRLRREILFTSGCPISCQ